MVPAHECFDARDVSARQPNDGLILEYELTAFDCALEGGGEIQPLERGGMQGRFIQLVPVLPLGLRGVHRYVRIAEQDTGIGFARTDRDTDTRRHDDVSTFQPHRRMQGQQDAAGGV